MIIQKTLVNQIEVTEAGTAVRLEICVFNDDKKISSRWHRTFIDDVVPAELQMAHVNAHLTAMGELPVSDEDIDDIRLHNDLRKTLKATRDDRALGEPLDAIIPDSK